MNEGRLEKLSGEAEPESAKPEIVFPEGLTPKDRKLVMRQCEIQEATSKEQIEGFARAYEHAKKLAQDKEWWESLTPEKLISLILELGVFVEGQNSTGFRRVPATFRAGTEHALDPSKIEHSIEQFAQAYVEEGLSPEGRLSPDEAYIEFEKIHPFKDGNGRVGDLLWKMAKTRQTGSWPEELPPDFFGGVATTPKPTHSTFGEIEK